MGGLESRLLEALSRYGIVSIASGNTTQDTGTQRQGGATDTGKMGGRQRRQQGEGAEHQQGRSRGRGSGALGEDPRVAALLQGLGGTVP